MAVPRTVIQLAICQAVFVTGSVLVVSVSSLVGLDLAPDPRLATLPAACLFLSAMVTALPASLLMKKIGRRHGFVLGVTTGGAGALVSAAAVAGDSFSLFCLGSALLGVMSGTAQFYRFAAADAVTTVERPRAISVVLAGGLAAAFLGPNLARWTRLALPATPFLGSFLALAALQAVGLGVLSLLRTPPLSTSERSVGGRSLRRLVTQPHYALAVLAAVAAYGTMNILMMATPLAMKARGFEFGATASVIQWHAVGMFAPSFVSGGWVARFGSARVMLAGTALLIGSAATNLAGASMWHFWTSLATVGVGWNLLFVAASTLLTSTHSESEKAKAQGLNDLLIFGTVAVTALLAGSLYETIGWRAMNLAVTAPLFGVMVACLFVGLGRDPAPVDR